MKVIRIFGWLGYLIWQIIVGSWRVVVNAWKPAPFGSPAIIEYQMRCVTDTEIAMFTSAITITPGTLVVGVVAADPDGQPRVFVHSLFDNDRDSVVAGLAALEWQLLHALRAGGMRRPRS